jgi:hypothetical protein
MTSNDYPFTVTGAGSPALFTGYDMTGAILRGGLTALHGVTFGVPCRIVEDSASPLRFSVIGEMRYTKRDVKGRDDTERWVLLKADMDVLRANSSLFGKQVRIEYQPSEVMK